MGNGDVATMETDNTLATATVSTLPAPPPTPAAPAQGQSDMEATLLRLLAPMQQQLTQLGPMHWQLQGVALGLETVTNKVAYLEADREDSDFDSYDGEEDEETGLLEEEAMNVGGDASLAKPTRKGRVQRPF